MGMKLGITLCTVISKEHFIISQLKSENKWFKWQLLVQCRCTGCQVLQTTAVKFVPTVCGGFGSKVSFEKPVKLRSHHYRDKSYTVCACKTTSSGSQHNSFFK